jgi:hypothetical protein
LHTISFIGKKQPIIFLLLIADINIRNKTGIAAGKPAVSGFSLQ